MSNRKSVSRLPKSQVGYVLCNDTLSIFIDDQSYSIDESHPNFKMVMKELDGKQRPHILAKLVNVKKAVERFMKGRVVVDPNNDTVTYNGNPVEPVISEKILSFMKQGLDARPLVLFLDKLMKNPSKRALTEAFKFIQHVGLPIDKKGNLIAYKAIRTDWYDKYTGKILNKIGKVISINRNEVDDDFGVNCSEGIHVGNFSYAKSFGGSDCRIVLVSVSPEDIVSVPSDCSCQKCRVCKYKVVAEYKGSDPIPDLIYVS